MMDVHKQMTLDGGADYLKHIPIEVPPWMSDPEFLDSNQHCHLTKKHRSIWISDTHLGTPGSKADLLSDFLKYNTCDTLYLVGDIIDGWRMKRKAYWPQAHINVIRRILTCSKRGTKVVYITGNHDEFLRKYSGMSFGNIHLVDEYVHTTVDRKKLWVIHGDAFDAIVCNQKWLAVIGDVAYETLLKLNVYINRLRRLLNMDYWSLSSFVKYKVKKAVNFISGFENTLANECKKRGFSGVVCGHIHHPEVRQIDSVQYANSGDWVESCSALVEDFSGNINVVCWTKPMPDAGSNVNGHLSANLEVD